MAHCPGRRHLSKECRAAWLGYCCEDSDLDEKFPDRAAHQNHLEKTGSKSSHLCLTIDDSACLEWLRGISNIHLLWDFPGGPVVKNPSASAGDMGLIPPAGRSHVLQGN